MDAIQKELDKLHKRLPGLALPRGYNIEAPSSSNLAKIKGKDASSNLFYTIDSLIDRLEAAQQRLAPHVAFSTGTTAESIGASPSSSLTSPSAPPVDLDIFLSEIRSEVEHAQKSVADRQKEFYGPLSKFGKHIEKKFPTSVSNVADPLLFSSLPAQRALESVVLEHLLREGDWDLATMLAEVCRSPSIQSRGSIRVLIWSNIGSATTGSSAAPSPGSSG